MLMIDNRGVIIEDLKIRGFDIWYRINKKIGNRNNSISYFYIVDLL